MFDKEEKRIARALRTSFSGKGMTGFREWLKIGGFLQRIDNDKEMHYHNDRCDIIEVMVGEGNMDKLVDHLCRGIMELSKDA